MALLEIAHLTKEFDGVTALQDVSFDVQEREILGVIGPNGAGKTTLFNCVTGILPATRGTIRYQGESIQDRQPYEIARLGIGRTFQIVRPLKTAAMLVIALAVAGCDSPKNDTLQGYAEGEYVREGAPYAGALVRLDVQRGSSVTAGAPLFALEAENESAARREAEDRLGSAQAQLENLRKGRRPTEIDAARAQLAQAQAAAVFSAAELKRQEDLLARGFATRQQLEEARTAVARDRTRVAELQAQLATAHLAARPDEIRAAQAQAAAAKAALDQADWRLRQRTAVATVSGVVTDTLFVRGEWVGAGQPVVTLLPPENLKARFLVPEPRLGGVKLGQPVELRCDGCGDPIRETVTWIAPQPEYTPPVIYSRESRAKLVFLVEARPAPADGTRLKPGQPLDVVLR